MQMLIKLIPKKLSKPKYLKSYNPKKSVSASADEKRPKSKKPKATLMPCMISVKKVKEDKLKQLQALEAL